MSLMRVSCVLYYCYYTAVLLPCFRLVTTLVAFHDICRTKFGCNFRMEFHKKMDPLFLLEAHPKTTSENESLNNRHFGSIR